MTDQNSQARAIAALLDSAAETIRSLCDTIEAANLPATPHHDATIESLGLGGRATRSLRYMGIETVGQLIRHSADRLLQEQNLGETTLNEIRTKLYDLGLRLRCD